MIKVRRFFRRAAVKLLYAAAINLIVILLFSICSCGNSASPDANDTVQTDKPDTSRQGSAVDPLAIRRLFCFKLEKKQLDEYLSQDSGKLILKWSSKDLRSTDIVFTPVAYPAKNQIQHGENATPYYLIRMENCLPVENEKEYIFGNNYVKIKKLKKLIEGIESKVAYLKFTPKLSEVAGRQNQVVFRIQPYDAGDNPIEKQKAERIIKETNPSPPADADN